MVAEDTGVKGFASLVSNMREKTGRHKYVVDPIGAPSISRFFAIDPMAIDLGICQMTLAHNMGNTIEVQTNRFIEVAHEYNVAFGIVVVFHKFGHVRDKMFPGVRLIVSAHSEKGHLLVIRRELAWRTTLLAYLICAQDDNITTITTKEFHPCPSAEIVSYSVTDTSHKGAIHTE
jgi:hypothetical protein